MNVFFSGFYSSVIVPVLINFADLFSNTGPPKINCVNMKPHKHTHGDRWTHTQTYLLRKYPCSYTTLRVTLSTSHHFNNCALNLIFI